MSESDINYLIVHLIDSDRKINELEQENQQLKERVEYLERSNNRREETILNNRQEIADLYSVLDEIREKLNFYKTTEWGIRGYGILNKFDEILDKVKE